MIGGAGADEFQFTQTSTQDTISDFNISDGDTLKFFNTGAAKFNLDSVEINASGDELSILYDDEVLTFAFTDAGLQLDDPTK